MPTGKFRMPTLVWVFALCSLLCTLAASSLWAAEHYGEKPRQALEKLAQSHESQLEQYIDRSVFLSLDNVFRLPIPSAREEAADYMLRLITFEQNITALVSDLNASGSDNPVVQWYMDGFPYGDTLYITSLDRLDATIAHRVLEMSTSKIHYPQPVLHTMQDDTAYLRFYRNLTGMLGNTRVILCVNMPYAPLMRNQQEAQQSLDGISIRHLMAGDAPQMPASGSCMTSRMLPDGSRYAAYVSYARWIMTYLLPLLVWACICLYVMRFACFMHRQAEKSVADGLSVLIDAAESGRQFVGGQTETETEKLITRVGEVYQRQLLRQRQSDLLRVQLMQERMNPHLLYNFLTSVKMSALRNGDEQLATLSQTMAAFFAEAVSNGENDLALVASELNMANQFILLSNLLYGKEITLMVKVEPHLRHGKILRHIIQPLVENAYKHGFAQQANGIIKIIGKQEGGYRQITVIDTGCGMDEDTCRALENGGCKRQRGGYAMANLYQRMKLFYGQTACIQVFSIPGQGSSIRLLFK